MRTLGDTPRKTPIAPKQEETKPQQKLPVEPLQTDDVFDESVVIE
jgi:hypothetical protein